MSEQFPLNFGEQTENSSLEYEKLTPEERAKLYKEKVRVSVRIGMTEAEIMAGIMDPEAERKRLGQMDKEDDRADVLDTYRR